MLGLLLEGANECFNNSLQPDTLFYSLCTMRAARVVIAALKNIICIYWRNQNSNLNSLPAGQCHKSEM